ncbi:hypothetical protein C8Q78DRAFT_988366 [Trametes maxima]|nr:hypothetical protein C8Q78DRAFT_988366 [Trametes maxima]
MAPPPHNDHGPLPTRVDPFWRLYTMATPQRGWKSIIGKKPREQYSDALRALVEQAQNEPARMLEPKECTNCHNNFMVQLLYDLEEVQPDVDAPTYSQVEADEALARDLAAQLNARTPPPHWQATVPLQDTGNRGMSRVSGKRSHDVEQADQSGIGARKKPNVAEVHAGNTADSPLAEDNIDTIRPGNIMDVSEGGDGSEASGTTSVSKREANFRSIYSVSEDEARMFHSRQQPYELILADIDRWVGHRRLQGDTEPVTPFRLHWRLNTHQSGSAPSIVTVRMMKWSLLDIHTLPVQGVRDHAEYEAWLWEMNSWSSVPGKHVDVDEHTRVVFIRGKGINNCRDLGKIIDAVEIYRYCDEIRESTRWALFGRSLSISKREHPAERVWIVFWPEPSMVPLTFWADRLLQFRRLPMRYLRHFYRDLKQDASLEIWNEVEQRWEVCNARDTVVIRPDVNTLLVREPKTTSRMRYLGAELEGLAAQGAQT